MNIVQIIIICCVFIWLISLSFFLIRVYKHYNDLTRGMTKLGLREILEHILKEKKQLSGRVTELEKNTQAILLDSKTHIQKIGILRFNPFSDTGGSQSFAMALLDMHDNGIVITSLYARTGNRWYVKEIRKGKGVNIDISKEEKTVIEKAQKIIEGGS